MIDAWTAGGACNNVYVDAHYDCTYYNQNFTQGAFMLKRLKHTAAACTQEWQNTHS